MSLKKKIGILALAALAVLVLLFIFLPVVAWILVGLAVLILAVVLLTPVGADIGYIGGELRLAARLDGFTLQLLPRKPEDPNKPKKEKKPKEPKEPQEERPAREPKPGRKFSFTKDELLELAKKAIRGLGKFGKLTVRRFMLHYVAAGEDPYDTVMTYNFVNAALCVLAPLCAGCFRVRGDTDVRTDIDFTSDKTRVDFEISITLRLIQAAHALLAVAFGALGVLIRSKRRQRREAKLLKQNGPAEENEEITITIEPDDAREEERND